MKRLAILAALAGIVVFGGVYAMAASLGGITTTSLGADDSAVASCDADGVSTSYTTAYDSTDKRYEVTTVTVAGIANTCDGKVMKVTLTDGTSSLAEGTLTIPADALVTQHDVTFSVAPSAETTTAVHVVISG